MKRFDFSLAKVRDYRRQQLELEEVRLQSLLGERLALELESSRLETEVRETRCSLMVTSSAESQDLTASDMYLRHLAAEKKRHAAKVAEWQARAVKQQQAVVEARRRVRLVEKLEARQFRVWKASADRELENLAAELYLARWKTPQSR
jgi:flagellar export protein FliJ